MCSCSVTPRSLQPHGPWTVACAAPLSMGFSRPEDWSGWLFPPPGGLPTQGSSLCLSCLLLWQVDSLPPAPPGKPTYYVSYAFFLVLFYQVFTTAIRRKMIFSSFSRQGNWGQRLEFQSMCIRLQNWAAHYSMGWVHRLLLQRTRHKY